MAKTFLLILLISFGFVTQATASGCDYSCWSSTTKELNVSRWSFNDYFKVSGVQHGNWIQIEVKKESEKPYFPVPVTFGGYELKNGIHPRLVNRILDPNEKYTGTVTKRDIEVVVTDYNYQSTAFESGQYLLEIRFETGESVTLYYPTFRDMVEREDGSINYDKLLPLFFKK